MTDRLSHLKALNEARTKGPWETVKAIIKPDHITGSYPRIKITRKCTATDVDAAFIAALANNADWLIGCVEAAERLDRSHMHNCDINLSSGKSGRCNCGLKELEEALKHGM